MMSARTPLWDTSRWAGAQGWGKGYAELRRWGGWSEQWWFRKHSGWWWPYTSTWSSLNWLHLFPNLEREMATHSSVPAWRIPWSEEPGGPQSTGVAKSGTWLGTTQHSWTWPWRSSEWPTFAWVMGITDTENLLLVGRKWNLVIKT